MSIVTFSSETTRRGGTVIDAMTWTAGDLTMSVMKSHSPGASISMMMRRNGGDMRELFMLRRVVVNATDLGVLREFGSVSQSVVRPDSHSYPVTCPSSSIRPGKEKIDDYLRARSA
ncbi:hypothetical protein Sjap_015953 [Stephania japonica]|uniref:Uncharacterized protein n=1 Tax=Stephania japonica TaxID=461633 RepID=A0AAP0IK33_9MAGN